MLILDDLGLRKMNTSEANDFCDLLKSRIEKSTIITTQLPIEHWAEIIEDPVIADTSIDRMIHTSLKIEPAVEKLRGKNLTRGRLKSSP